MDEAIYSPYFDFTYVRKKMVSVTKFCLFFFFFSNQLYSKMSNLISTFSNKLYLHLRSQKKLDPLTCIKKFTLIWTGSCKTHSPVSQSHRAGLLQLISQGEIITTDPINIF